MCPDGFIILLDSVLGTVCSSDLSLWFIYLLGWREGTDMMGTPGVWRDGEEQQGGTPVFAPLFPGDQHLSIDLADLYFWH